MGAQGVVVECVCLKHTDKKPFGIELRI